MTHPNDTPQPSETLDELDKILWNAIIQAVAGSINAPDDVVDTTDISERCFIEAKIALLDYLDRTVAERVLAIIGEDEKRPDFINHNSRSDTKRRGRNELRAELRAAVQTQGESNE